LSALEGLRVVELGGFAAGPAVGKHLADHGAEVIRIESRSRPDGFRANYPPYKDNLPGLERAAMFAITNNDKLGVTLNLKNPAGLGLARRLIDRADVVVENFTPGTMERLGLAYATLAESNPRLVMLSTCNQGQTGPHALRAGFGTHLTAQSGFLHLTGWPDRTPSLLWGPYIDYIAVAYGFAAVMAALDQRARAGAGCHIDLSQYETGLQFAAPILLDYAASGRVASRVGNRDPAAVPHGVYPCRGRERWVAISVHDDLEWDRLVGALGAPEWARAPELAAAGGRRAREDELDAELAAWTSVRDREEVVEPLRRARVHVAPVNDMADIHSDPDLAAHRVFRPLRHPELGEYLAEGPPYLLSETPAEIEQPAFRLGEHNHYVFCELLGLAAEEYAVCEAAGAFE
jgi:benzylsuccinate CoA-transferase BbsF subunit